jgi:hypothetical protein
LPTNGQDIVVRKRKPKTDAAQHHDLDDIPM